MNSEFIVVKQKRKKKQYKKLGKLPLNAVEDNFCKPLSEVLRIIKFAENEVSSSSYYAELLKLIEQTIQRVKPLDCQEIEILCYGLGHFSTDVSARYQLGLLLNIKSYFESTVFIYDPIFSELELKILKSYNFNIITTNEKGKRLLSNKFTFVYLPHCPHWLVNNFLWKNWAIELTRCILFTNSFSEIHEVSQTDKLKKTLKYLYNIINFNCVLEKRIDNTFKFIDIFNSLSLHTFPLIKINNIIGGELSDLEEPFNCSDSEDNIVKISQEFEDKLSVI